MTEKEFRLFLEAKIANNGLVPQMSGYTDNPVDELKSGGEYCGGHSILFNGHDKLPRPVILEIGELIFKQEVSLGVKESILMILAHHPTKTALRLLKRYNDNPHYELRYFARIAYDECKMWNE